jgi:hypothetical protein
MTSDGMRASHVGAVVHQVGRTVWDNEHNHFAQYFYGFNLELLLWTKFELK